MKQKLLTALVTALIFSCCHKGKDYDASGNFEADEVIVSAQQNGEILSLSLNEGDVLTAGQVIGQIDVTLPQLQKQQTEASISSLKKKTNSPAEQTAFVRKQLAVQQARREQLGRERTRTENLVKADAATRKQLDDIDAAIEQTDREIAATNQQIKLNLSNNATQNRSILSEAGPLQIAAQQFQEQINRGSITNPVKGTVLTKYALAGEFTSVGKPLYKIANLDTLTLKAYITGGQLPQIKIGQQVTARIDLGDDKYKNYTGKIVWISSKSEFTPKTIQTRNERANLVYAVKVRVRNDGFLKIGMYGEALLGDQSKGN